MQLDGFPGSSGSIHKNKWCLEIKTQFFLLFVPWKQVFDFLENLDADNEPGIWNLQSFNMQ